MEEKKFNDIEKANEKKGRCVYAAPVARALLHRGFSVIDIKPNKADRNRTVCVFEETDNFNAALEEVLSEYIEKKEAKAEQKRLNAMQREAAEIADYVPTGRFNDSNY